MKRIKRYNETNGPAYGKEETTKRGLKFTPLTTINPMITDIVEEPDNEDEEAKVFSDEEISIEMEEEFDVNKKFVLFDRGLNVVHLRSDIASWFVEGGSVSLHDISGEGSED